MTNNRVLFCKGSEQGTIAELIDAPGYSAREPIDEPRDSGLESKAGSILDLLDAMINIVTGFPIAKRLEAIAHANALPQGTKRSGGEFLFKFWLSDQQKTHQLVILDIQI